MVQILPQINYIGKKQEGGVGEFLSGLGSGLEKLAQGKAQEIQRKKTAQRYQQAGYTPEAAQILGHFEETQPQNLPKYLELIGQGGYQQPQVSVSSQSSGQGLSNGVGSLVQSGQQSPLFSGKAHSAALKEQEKIAADKFKATKDIRHSILQDKKVARSELHDLNMMQELNESGKLDTPGYVEFLKRSGLELPALLSPESEQFQKIEKGFLKNIGNYFKGSISSNEINQFLQTIPTLSQSAEGRKRVIAMLKHVNRAKYEYANALNDIVKESGGVPPYDLEERIEDKVEAKIEKLSSLFKKDLIKEIPKGQNKFITALQAAAGSSIKPFGTALAGAAVGSVLPGVGTIAGGLAGGLGGVGAKLAGLI